MNPWPYPRLVAHRGGGSLAPENTVAAIRLGQSLGYRAVEFDVKLSRDGVAFLLHDATLDRTTSGSGPAGERDWGELARLDAGEWLSDAFRGEPIPRLDDVARVLRERGTAANIEIKPAPGTDAMTGRAVAKLARSLWAGAPVAPLLSSFSPEALMAAREAAPELPRGYIVGAPAEADFDRLREIEAVSLHCSRKAASPGLLERTRAIGCRLLVWTVNDPPEAKRLLDGGVDGIITDNLRQFAARFPELL